MKYTTFNTIKNLFKKFSFIFHKRWVLAVGSCVVTSDMTSHELLVRVGTVAQDVCRMVGGWRGHYPENATLWCTGKVVLNNSYLICHQHWAGLTGRDVERKNKVMGRDAHYCNALTIMPWEVCLNVTRKKLQRPATKHIWGHSNLIMCFLRISQIRCLWFIYLFFIF